MNKKIIAIECPYCGAEYLPAEIIVPNSFFGKPTNVERDFNHKIIDYMNTSLDLKDYYICDYCNNRFNINTKIFFNTTKNENDLISDYKTPLGKQRLFYPEK